LLREYKKVLKLFFFLQQSKNNYLQIIA